MNTEQNEIEQGKNNSNLKVSWRASLHALIGAEISSLTKYMKRTTYILRSKSDNAGLFNYIKCAEKNTSLSTEQLSEKLGVEYNAVILNGLFNHENDIEGLLRNLWSALKRSDRVISVAYNPYYRWLYELASKLGIRQGESPSTYVTVTDLTNLSSLSGFQVVRIRPVGFIPWDLSGIGTMLNRILASLPLMRFFSFAWVITLRPIKREENKPSLSILIPARNEKGNIESALARIPDLGAKLEIIFVEGHSNDGTWEEIERVSKLYQDRYQIKTFKQTGKGKADAVRLGFSKATNDLFVILDADLSMPPELLGRFYDAWCRGLADFINGNRLVYPMEGQAMRFLNWLGNIFFAKALSFVLDVRIGDSLCGTKLVSASDYKRFCDWRREFGDIDPFGDFELLFPASQMGLGIIDVPIRYRDRVYGSTNISRFHHGMMLLRMTTIGFLHLKLGQRPHGLEYTAQD